MAVLKWAFLFQGCSKTVISNQKSLSEKPLYELVPNCNSLSVVFTTFDK